ncbi:dipeptidase [Herpetosiphon sp. NSE202]|uniref:dipeptidase n=1 Tax=Herpetosiphon sp. NSE202 TaxID=3351349 RepID=UPI00363F8DD8
MILVDAHLDLAYNAINLGRDLTQTVDVGRQRAAEHTPEWIAEAGTLTTTLPEIGLHQPSIVCGTIFILPADAQTTLDGVAYATPDEAHDQAWEQLNWYKQKCAAGHLHFIDNQQALEAVQGGAGSLPGLVLLMEGADGLRTPAELIEWHAAGLRWLGPAWQATRYAGGTGQPGPFTAAGLELLGLMQELGVALDASHLAEESFWQALDRFNGPIAASHSNCRNLLAKAEHQDRYLSDAMIKAIIERDGVIGIALYNRMLRADWDGSKNHVNLEHVLAQIEHVCQLAGNSRHVALGSDLDGGFGVEMIPAEIDRWSDLPKIGQALAARGWQETDIANLMGQNWLRWFQTIL